MSYIGAFAAFYPFVVDVPAQHAHLPRWIDRFEVRDEDSVLAFRVVLLRFCDFDLGTRADEADPLGFEAGSPRNHKVAHVLFMGWPGFLLALLTAVANCLAARAEEETHWVSR